MDRAALENLTVTLAEEPNNAGAWRLSAIAHGRLGNEAMTALALAESALARGKYEEARGRAEHASGLLQENTAPWLRAQDLMNERSEEHTSELQSLMRISYAVFCLKQKNNKKQQ